MRKSLLRLSRLAAIALLLGACTGESSLPTANGTATFRLVNAIPTSPSIALLIEERAIASAEYKGTTAPSEYDNLMYTFNFEAFLAGETTRSRLASMDIDTQRDMEYTFLVSGLLATPTVTLWETERREWAGTETVFEARFAHTAESRGALDVYWQMPGIPPAAGQEAGTVSFGEILPALDYPAGDYVLILTTAGNPGDIVFTSGTITPTARSSLVYSVFDGDANDLGPIAVRQFSDVGTNTAVVDAGLSPVIRFIHATPNLATADIYTDEAVTEQILANHAYRDVSAELPLAAGATTLTYTAAGDVGSILLESDITIQAGNRYNFFVVGLAGALRGVPQVPDRRSVETLAKFNFIHTDTNHAAVDLYIVTAGTDIATVAPRFFNVTVGALTANVGLQAGDFELYLTPNAAKTVLAGPVAFSPALGDIVYYISYNNVDPAIADLVPLPLP